MGNVVGSLNEAVPWLGVLPCLWVFVWLRETADKQCFVAAALSKTLLVGGNAVVFFTSLAYECRTRDTAEECSFIYGALLPWYLVVVWIGAIVLTRAGAAGVATIPYAGRNIAQLIYMGNAGRWRSVRHMCRYCYWRQDTSSSGSDCNGSSSSSDIG